MLIKYIITFGFKTILVKWIFVFVFRTSYIQTLIRRQSESIIMTNRTRIYYAQSIFFRNITRRQVISPVAKIHHVLGRGLLIQRVILFFTKCLSANQNQIFYIE